MPGPKPRLRRDNTLVFASLAIPLIMTNPPVIGWVSDYSADQPVTLGLPTFWLWLEAWYAIMLILLVVFAIRLPSWRADRLERRIEELDEGGR